MDDGSQDRPSFGSSGPVEIRSSVVVPAAPGSAGRAASSPGMCEAIGGRLSRPMSRIPGTGRDYHVRSVTPTS